MLILFDIDQTLITTGGAGRAAMEDAGRQLFGDHFTAEGVDFAGSIDPVVVGRMFASAGVENSSDNLLRFRRAYRECLDARLLLPAHQKQVLPGVPPLLGALRETRSVTMGLLTGNFAETARAKLDACGIDGSVFSICAWGDESPSTPPTRDDLPRVALGRWRDIAGDLARPERCIVVGDTPHDVRCARTNRCRSLAVATGRFTLEDLRGAGADCAVADLSDTPAILRWMLNP